jgi:uncharacterized membrane protein YhhN
MKNLSVSVIYFIIGLISIILMNLPAFFPGFISKALIIPVLVILFLVNINPFKNRLHGFILAGLFFSWAGDVVLEFSNNSGNMFIVGLVCFLLAHIMYFIVFLLTPGKNSVLTNRIWLLIPVIIYGLVLIVYLYADLAAMRLPVIIYAAVILTMLSGAINRLEKVNRKSYYLVLAGAILFVISDSSIAVNKFSHQFESSGIVIMSTYIVAQYLIVAGYISQIRASNTDQITW